MSPAIHLAIARQELEAFNRTRRPINLAHVARALDEARAAVDELRAEVTAPVTGRLPIV